MDEVTHEVRVRCPHAERCDLEVRGHTVRVDQLREFGGTDTGPTPLELFVAALAASVGQGAKRYLRQRDLVATVEVTAGFRAPGGRVAEVDVDVAVPGLPAGLRDSFSAAMGHCAVLDCLRRPPTVSLQVRAGQEKAAPRHVVISEENDMAEQPPRPDRTDIQALEQRVGALESRMRAVTDAVRALARGLEGTPMAEPGEEQDAVARAARQAHDLLLLVGEPPQRSR